MLYIAVFVLIQLAVGSFLFAHHQISTSRAEKRARQEEIARGKHEAALVTRAREKQMERQMQLGDQLFVVLHQAWGAAGSPSKLTPRHIRNGRSYYIEVGRPTSGPAGILFWMHIDFSREGEEVCITGSIPFSDKTLRRLTLSAAEGKRAVRILAQRLYPSR